MREFLMRKFVRLRHTCIQCRVHANCHGRRIKLCACQSFVPANSQWCKPVAL